MEFYYMFFHQIQHIFFNLLRYLLKNLNLNMIKLLTIIDLLITKKLLQSILLHKFLVKLFLKLILLQQLEMLILQLGFGLGILMQLIQTAWHLHYQLKKKLEVPFNPQHEHDTRSLKIAQLENENQQLKEYIKALEHPGTTSLSSIMKYPFMKTISSEEKPKTRPKAFKFRNIVNTEEITKE